MKNTSEKAKKWAIIAGLGLVCCVMIVLIGGKFITTPPNDDNQPDIETSAPDITPNPDVNVKDPTEIVIKPSTDSIPTDNGAISFGTEQTIQGDPVKPSEPPKPDTAPADASAPHDPPKDTTLTDPAKKPDSTPKPQEPTKPKEPAGGTTNDKGEVWMPGFGWVKPSTAEGEKSDSDGDWDKIIGN